MDYKLRDIKAEFGFMPLINNRKLVVLAEDVEPTMFDSMRKATKALGVGEKVIRYAKEKNRDFFKRTNGDGRTKVFFKKWC